MFSWYLTAFCISLLSLFTEQELKRIGVLQLVSKTEDKTGF